MICSLGLFARMTALTPLYLALTIITGFCWQFFSLLNLSQSLDMFDAFVIANSVVTPIFFLVCYAMQKRHDKTGLAHFEKLNEEAKVPVVDANFTVEASL